MKNEKSFTSERDNLGVCVYVLVEYTFSDSILCVSILFVSIRFVCIRFMSIHFVSILFIKLPIFLC
jgi:hypothetical protein